MKKIILFLLLSSFLFKNDLLGQNKTDIPLIPIQSERLIQEPVFQMRYLSKEFVLNSEGKILISSKTMIENLANLEKLHFIAYQRIEKIVYLLPNSNALIPSVKKLIATY